jgi:hypothetical protein
VALRLKLGPVVGHTDDTSARVWIQARDHPGQYKLRVQGAGRFDFVSTEGQPEFGTGIAIADGLRPDHVYGYTVLRRGRLVVGARGTFRTMPSPGSPASLLFCVVSCNQTRNDGVWELFAAFVEKARPHFVLTMGDQVYMDENFTVAPGIRSTLREVTRDFNFGVVQVVPTGTGAEIVPTLAHEGTAAVAGLDFAALVR